ncbi:MAG: Alpha-1,3-mannosyltransferase-like protein [Trizodia sp. TS-e1964]|nr:MAG: Alpha-1,3-mannosyltransferase-like protein [Trizodia sp. TS-e1964]
MSKKNIIFIHPDLGIGGAERLVIDAAVGLQDLGHSVTIFTSHCDPKHCFDEARNGKLEVRVRGNSVFPANFHGRFSILCAILRQLHLVTEILWSGELSKLQPTTFFVDQLSACIPLLRISHGHARILFYCHFPDKLLASRQTLLKTLYRIPFDWIEAFTTGLSDLLVVNSEFTASVFRVAFPMMAKRKLRVVYPCVNTKADGAAESKSGDIVFEPGNKLWKNKKIILSINRFERKKNIELAINAYAELSPEKRSGVRLVLAGGYDNRVHENVSYHTELSQLAASLGLKSATTKTIVSALNVPTDTDVLFLLSIPAALKNALLRSARLLVYTPSNEHFGIVPLEAMLAGVPVLAATTGGPLETVVDGQTGWLRDASDPSKWSEIMQYVLHTMSENQLKTMSLAGQVRVRENFSEQKMAQSLSALMEQMRWYKRRRWFRAPAFVLFSIVGVFSVVLAYAWPRN